MKSLREMKLRGLAYAILDEMVGFVDSGTADASVNHDEVIYELQSKT